MNMNQSLDSVKVGSVFCKVAPFDLGDISNKSLVTCLHDFMEDDPICFPVLSKRLAEKSPTFRNKQQG